MKIYKIDGDLDYVDLYFIDKEALEQNLELWLTPGPIASLWKPVPLTPWIDRETPDYVLPDIASVSGKIALSPRAVEVLRPIFGDYAEFLPVTVAGSPYFILRTFAVLTDVIEGSDGVRTARYWPTFQFRPDRVDSLPPVFKIWEDTICTFVTSPVIEAIERADLSGGRKDLAWSPETGGVEIEPLPVFYEDLKEKRREEKAKRAALREKLGLPPWKPQPRKQKETPQTD